MPAYRISGDEPLLTAEAADAVRAPTRARRFTERETHFIERASDWVDVRSSASNLSLFATKRVVEIRLNSAKPGVSGGAALVDLLESPDADGVLLILAPRLERDAQNSQWAHARCTKLKLAVPDDALEILAERTEGNLLAANQELEKLRLMLAEYYSNQPPPGPTTGPGRLQLKNCKPGGGPNIEVRRRGHVRAIDVAVIPENGERDSGR